MGQTSGGYSAKNIFINQSHQMQSNPSLLADAKQQYLQHLYAG